MKPIVLLNPNEIIYSMINKVENVLIKYNKHKEYKEKVTLTKTYSEALRVTHSFVEIVRRNPDMYLTEEQIYQKAIKKSNTYLGQKREANKLFRKMDESHLWPISGKFNATERAIRNINKIERANGTMGILEYIYCVEAEISRIVNDPKNQ